MFDEKARKLLFYKNKRCLIYFATDDEKSVAVSLLLMNAASRFKNMFTI